MVEGPAGKVPSQLVVVVRWDVGVWSTSNDIFTVAIDVLEQEAGILPTVLLWQVEQYVGTQRNTSRQRMVRAGQVVRLAMDDEETRVDMIDSQSHRPAGWTYSLREAKGKVADECTDDEDDADQTHLFPPCALLGFLRLAKASQDGVWTPEGDDGTVYIPKARSADGVLFPQPPLLHCNLFSCRLPLQSAGAAGVSASWDSLVQLGVVRKCSFLIVLVATGRITHGTIETLHVGALCAESHCVLLHDGIVARRRGMDCHALSMFTVMVVWMISVDPVPLWPD